MDNDIQYRRSTQDVYDANWSSERTKEDVEKLENYIKFLNEKSDDELIESIY
jgi:spore coat protein CotH